MKIKKIEGLIAASFTPMNEDGSINGSMISSYATKLKKDRLSGVFVCGSTGEGMLLELDERKLVAEKWLAEQTDDFRVIVHVGTTSSKQSYELADHAQKAGAYAVGCMVPSFIKPSRVEGIVGFCAEVAAGCPDLPFYYYHIPSISGVTLSISEFIKLAAIQIPNFAGIKYSDNNFLDMQQCLNLENGRWDILHGYDESLIAGLAFGAVGAVGSTYNYLAPLYNGIIEDFNNRDIEEAKKKQATSARVIEILFKYGGAVVSGKALMKSVGIDCGNCRLPFSTLSEEAYENLITDLEKEGIFE